jgi:hypothetical protein
MVMATNFFAAITFSQLLETKTEANESTVTTETAIKVGVTILSLSKS